MAVMVPVESAASPLSVVVWVLVTESSRVSVEVTPPAVAVTVVDSVEVAVCDVGEAVRIEAGIRRAAGARTQAEQAHGAGRRAARVDGIAGAAARVRRRGIVVRRAGELSRWWLPGEVRGRGGAGRRGRVTAEGARVGVAARLVAAVGAAPARDDAARLVTLPPADWLASAVVVSWSIAVSVAVLVRLEVAVTPPRVDDWTAVSVVVVVAVLARVSVSLLSAENVCESVPPVRTPPPPRVWVLVRVAVEPPEPVPVPVEASLPALWIVSVAVTPASVETRVVVAVCVVWPVPSPVLVPLDVSVNVPVAAPLATTPPAPYVSLSVSCSDEVSVWVVVRVESPVTVSVAVAVLVTSASAEEARQRLGRRGRAGLGGGRREGAGLVPGVGVAARRDGA